MRAARLLEIQHLHRTGKRTRSHHNIGIHTRRLADESIHPVHSSVLITAVDPVSLLATFFMLFEVVSALNTEFISLFIHLEVTLTQSSPAMILMLLHVTHTSFISSIWIILERGGAGLLKCISGD